MRSSELGSLAGVTVRTLRHYHQVGLLQEPERGPNGYRRYDVHDLIRVLRIRRLAVLGIPLDQMPGLLDDDADGGAAVLDRLDAELAAQAERLRAQRKLIAEIREGQLNPDVPPELARFLGRPEAAISPEMARLDRDQTVLLAHLAGADGLPHLVGFYERASDPTLAPMLAELDARFEGLGDDTDPRELDRLADDLVEALSPLALDEDTTDLDRPRTSALITEFTESVLNRAQQDVLVRIDARWDSR